ncbi:hypothetical protein HNQ77_004069 [Silvibacterium bohemicum]|uniref:Transmembrane protein n=1 Tax=Silvibacterium bohemicum TaxID=1577686 RepID=A0A841K2F4_9BACT|nr:hypothetical protein [Silvibacterium bohemicum]MBB6146099.1 hypothetical protein [Silvibacterium bohemicum]
MEIFFKSERWELSLTVARNYFCGSSLCLEVIREWPSMLKFLLFCLLLVLCWPLALLALVLYPLVWLILLPFRLIGIVVGGTFELVGALFMLPVRLLREV